MFEHMLAEGTKPSVTETKRARPKAPRVTHFIQLQPFGVFVVEAEQYIATGGDPYSTLWMPVVAHSEDAARTIGEQLVLRLAGKK